MLRATTSTMFSSYLLLCSVFYLDLCPVYLSGRTRPASQPRRRAVVRASPTHEADILAQPNATPLKTNIRDKVFIIRLSLFRRTTPVPESTVNAENTNGRGPWGLSPNVLSLLIIYLRPLAQIQPSSSLFLILTPFLTVTATGRNP